MKRMASILIALLLFLTSLLASSTLVHAQTAQPCSASTCQTIFPADIPYTGVAPVQNDPQPPVFGGDVYVSNKGSNTVSVLMGTTNVANVSVGSAPLEPAYDPANGLVYVPNSGSDTVSVLSGAGLEATVQVGNVPLTPAYDPANGYVYVPNSGGCSISFQAAQCGDTVSVISGTTVVATIQVGTAPQEPAVYTAGGEFYGYVYVPNAVEDNSSMGTVSIISPQTNQVVKTLELGTGAPPGAFFDRLNGYVYAGAYVIEGTTELGELSEGGCTATSCVLDPYNGIIYSPGDTTMFVISGNNTSSFYCQTCGGYATFDPLNGWVYAGWAVSGTVPFAYLGVSTELSGVHDVSSFDPETGAVYASCGGCYYDTGLNTSHPVERHGDVAFLLGNTCMQLPSGQTYNSTVSAICGGTTPPVVANQTMTVYNGATGLPEALGGHVFSVLIDSLNLVSGHWNATSANNVTASFGKIQFTATGPDGTTGWATVVIPKVLVGLYLFAVLQGQGAPQGLLAQAAPTVYVDGQPVQATYFTSDSTNFYVTFQVHFSTHKVSIQFTPTSATSTPGSTTSATQVSTSTSSAGSGNSPVSTLGSSLTSSYVLVAAVALVLLILGAFIVRKLFHRTGPG